MSIPAHAVEVVIRVPFHDCDPLSVVWHGRYFQYLELARSALLQSCQLDVDDLRELGVRAVVSDARCRYNAPLSYNDEVAVTAWFSEYSPLLKISYDVRNLTSKRRSARAFTVLALTDPSGKLLSEVPNRLAERLPKK